MEKTNRYFAKIFDNSLRRRLARRESEVRLAVSVIRPDQQDRSTLPPSYDDDGYAADYEKLFPLPPQKLRDPEKAENEVFRMLDTVPRAFCGSGTEVPRDDLLDIGWWIGPQAAEIAAAAHDYGVGASIAVHIHVFPPGVSSWAAVEEEQDEDAAAAAAAGKPLSQDIQEQPEEVDDDDDSDDDDAGGGDDDDDDDDDDDRDDEQVRGSKRLRDDADDDDDDDDDDDEQARGSKRQRAGVI